MRILSTLNEIDPPVIPPLKKIERYQEEEKEWQVCRENPKYEVNSKGQWRTRDYQPEFPMAGTPWPFPKSKPASLSLFEQELARYQAQKREQEPKSNELLTIQNITNEALKILGLIINAYEPPDPAWDGTYRHFKRLRQAGKM